MQRSDQSVGLKIRQIERVYNAKPEGELLPACKVFVTHASKLCTEWRLCLFHVTILRLGSGRSRLLS
jgi:hypothetical protein